MSKTSRTEKTRGEDSELPWKFKFPPVDSVPIVHINKESSDEEQTSDSSDESPVIDEVISETCESPVNETCETKTPDVVETSKTTSGPVMDFNSLINSMMGVVNDPSYMSKIENFSETIADEFKEIKSFIPDKPVNSSEQPVKELPVRDDLESNNYTPRPRFVLSENPESNDYASQPTRNVRAPRVKDIDAPKQDTFLGLEIGEWVKLFMPIITKMLMSSSSPSPSSSSSSVKPSCPPGSIHINQEQFISQYTSMYDGLEHLPESVRGICFMDRLNKFHTWMFNQVCISKECNISEDYLKLMEEKFRSSMCNAMTSFNGNW